MMGTKHLLLPLPTLTLPMPCQQVTALQPLIYRLDANPARRQSLLALPMQSMARPR